MRVLFWLLMAHTTWKRDRGKEPTDLLVPPSWQGNPWGPAAAAARKSGELPPIPETPLTKQWDEWARKVAQDRRHPLFRRGDARIAGGLFPFSRFIANISGSKYSHVGTLVIEDGEPVVYDTTKASVRRQPLKVWVLDTVGAFGVKRLKPEYRNRIPKVVEYLIRSTRSRSRSTTSCRSTTATCTASRWPRRPSATPAWCSPSRSCWPTWRTSTSSRSACSGSPT